MAHRYTVLTEGYETVYITSEEKLTAKEIGPLLAGLFTIKAILILDIYRLLDLCDETVANRDQKLSSGPYKLLVG